MSMEKSIKDRALALRVGEILKLVSASKEEYQVYIYNNRLEMVRMVWANMIQGVVREEYKNFDRTCDGLTDFMNTVSTLGLTIDTRDSSERFLAWQNTA